MPHTWDTVILGAGVFGLSTARRLANQGHAVLVLDSAPVGTEASGWALGRIDPLLRGSGSTAKTGEANLLAKSEAQSDLALKSYAAHMELLGALEDEAGIDLQFDDRPTVQLLYSNAAYEEGVRNARHWTAQGFRSELVRRDDIGKLDVRYEAPEYGAIVMTGPFFIDSLSFVRALEYSARNAGAELQTARVTGLTASGTGVTVHSDQGHYSTAAVVVALGPWTGDFCRKLGANVRVTPSKGEILRMTVPEGGPFAHHIHGPCSLVHKKDGHVWVAATAAVDGFNREPTREAKEQLISHAVRMMPAMESSVVVRHTVCFRPASPDDLPVLGRLPVEAPIWVASGGGGSGIMHCLTVGAEAADMVAQGRSEPTLPGIALSRF